MADGFYAKTASNGKVIPQDQLDQLAVESGLEQEEFKQMLETKPNPKS